MTNSVLRTRRITGPIDPDSGFAEVYTTANIEAIMQKKAEMLQEFQENETGIKKIAVVSAKTGKSEDWIITQKRPYNHYTVARVGPGELPDALRGAFTSFVIAEAAIKNYVSTRKESYFDEVIAREHAD